MRYRNAFARYLFTAVLLLGVPSQILGDDRAITASNPLAPFERLVGGRWEVADSYQEFEWGVGRKSVRARSYVVRDGVAKPVSEGAWFWHPAERRIAGVFTAIDMPVVLFYYTTRFEDDVMICDLNAYDAEGNETRYEERWTFTSKDEYRWVLLSHSEEGVREEMAATYRRAPER